MMLSKLLQNIFKMKRESGSNLRGQKQVIRNIMACLFVRNNQLLSKLIVGDFW